jgi:hypothetical protein
MRCIECDALLFEYIVATKRYAVLCGMLERAGIPKSFGDLEFQKLKNEVTEARLNCHRARTGLSTHQETQFCRRSRPSQLHRSTARTAWESVAASGLKRLLNPIT